MVVVMIDVDVFLMRSLFFEITAKSMLFLASQECFRVYMGIWVTVGN